MVGLFKKAIVLLPNQVEGKFLNTYCNLVALSKGLGAALQILLATCRVWSQCRVVIKSRGPGIFPGY